MDEPIDMQGGDVEPTLVFIDTETTSLDADTGEVWEVGAIARFSASPDLEVERRWLLPVGLDHADPISLNIGRFHTRHPQGNARCDAKRRMLIDFALEFASLTHEALLVGNVVSFDEERLRKLLRSQGVVPSWHYHLVDVEAFAAGALGMAPPWNSAELCRRLGVPLPSDEDRHTALGDARWAMQIYDAAIRHRTVGR